MEILQEQVQDGQLNLPDGIIPSDLIEKVIAAVTSGDLSQLTALLSPDILQKIMEFLNKDG